MLQFFRKHIWMGFLVALLIACQTKPSVFPVDSTTPMSNAPSIPPIAISPSPIESPSAIPSPLPSPIAKPSSDPLALDQLVDIKTIAPTIQIDLRYATNNNFLKRAVYPRQARCLLRLTVAQQLAQVQNDLRAQGLRLKVWDCYRPLSVQRQMWAILPDSNYVANPAKGSRHNRGAAVEVTLVDTQGKELEMPTAFDDFSDRAAQDYPGGTATSRRNRQRLRSAMENRGFTAIATEWWHFDGAGWQQFPILDQQF